MLLFVCELLLHMLQCLTKLHDSRYSAECMVISLFFILNWKMGNLFKIVHIITWTCMVHFTGNVRQDTPFCPWFIDCYWKSWLLLKVRTQWIMMCTCSSLFVFRVFHICTICLLCSKHILLKSFLVIPDHLFTCLIKHMVTFDVDDIKIIYLGLMTEIYLLCAGPFMTWFTLYGSLSLKPNASAVKVTPLIDDHKCTSRMRQEWFEDGEGEDGNLFVLFMLAVIHCLFCLH